MSNELDIIIMADSEISQFTVHEILPHVNAMLKQIIDLAKEYNRIKYTKKVDLPNRYSVLCDLAAEIKLQEAYLIDLAQRFSISIPQLPSVTWEVGSHYKKKTHST